MASTVFANTQRSADGTQPVDFPQGLTGGPNVPYRNMIINGGMDYFQRRQTASIVGSGSILVADRMNWGTSNYDVTVTRSTDVPSQAQSGYQSAYSMMATNGTGHAPSAGDYSIFDYRMEGSDYQAIHAGKARISAWVKSSVTGTFPIALGNGAGSRSYKKTFTIASAGVWQKITFDVQLDSAGTWNFDNTVGMYVYIGLSAGSAFQSATLNAWENGNLFGLTGQTQWAATTGATFQITQLMVIPNDFTQNATANIPFCRAGGDAAGELALCQRYYEKSYDINTPVGSVTGNGRTVISGWSPTGTYITQSTTIRYSVSKRTAATQSFWDEAGNSGQWDVDAFGTSGVKATGLYLIQNGDTQFNIDNSTVTGGTLPTGGVYVSFYGQWSADAEL